MIAGIAIGAAALVIALGTVWASSLRGVVDRLDRAAVANVASSRVLLILVTEVLGKANLSAAASTQVAADLAIAQKAVEGVAADLADSHQRADAIVYGVPDADPGAAADAASASPVGEIS